MVRRMNEGKVSGIKQDRFRHSDFEYDQQDDLKHPQGVSQASINTLGNVGAENRGRRGDQLRNHRFNDDTPFENGRLTNWGNRKGWDEHLSQKSFRAGRRNLS